jgi:hypothetical protein
MEMRMKHTDAAVPADLRSQVRHLLGHASIVTTERYDNQKAEALMAAAKRLETGESSRMFRVCHCAPLRTQHARAVSKAASRWRD